MAANTGIVFSASITTQMEATVCFSFTFGGFPEVTVPRNPASGPPTAGGNVFAGARSDLTPQASVTSRIPESENFDVATTPARMIRRPTDTADNLIFQIDGVSRSITECIQLDELALHHQDDPDRVLCGLGSVSAKTRSDLATPRSVTPRVPELEAGYVMVTPSSATRHPAGFVDDLISQIDRVGRSIAECIQLGEHALRHHNDPDQVPFGLRNAATTYSDQIRVRLSDSATLCQIRSDLASGEELGFQHASFTLPPNRSSATKRRQIFVTSDDSDTRENETDEEKT